MPGPAVHQGEDDQVADDLLLRRRRRDQQQNPAGQGRDAADRPTTAA